MILVNNILYGIYALMMIPFPLIASRWLDNEISVVDIVLQGVMALFIFLSFCLRCYQDYKGEEKYDKAIVAFSVIVFILTAASIGVGIDADCKGYNGSEVAINLLEGIKGQLQIGRDLNLHITDQLKSAKNLTLNSSDQIQVARNLTVDISDQLQMAMNMTLNSSDQSQTDRNLTLDQLQIALNLTLDISNQLQIARNLTRNLNDQLQIARNLVLNINDQLQIARYLTLNISEQSQIISNLTFNTSDQLQRVWNLTLNITDQLQSARDLTLNISHQELSLAKDLKTNFSLQNKSALVDALKPYLDKESKLYQDSITYINYENESNFTTELDIYIYGIFEPNFPVELNSYLDSKEISELDDGLVKYINDNKWYKLIAKIFFKICSLLHSLAIFLIPDICRFLKKRDEEKKRAEGEKKADEMMSSRKPLLLIFANLDDDIHMKDPYQQYSIVSARPPLLNPPNKQLNPYYQYFLVSSNPRRNGQDQLPPLLIFSYLSYQQSEKNPNQKYILVHCSKYRGLPVLHSASVPYDQFQNNKYYFLVPINPGGYGGQNQEMTRIPEHQPFLQDY